jgi:hypothetical protein
VYVLCDDLKAVGKPPGCCVLDEVVEVILLPDDQETVDRFFGLLVRSGARGRT